jgi:glyoxylase-like metal-dependent hydrolase (beta-lactamase superfamily II)
MGPLSAIDLIDLHFLGLERAIGVYLVDTDDGPALFDCGPATTLPRLREALAERGLELSDIRHLLLSHIHLDHAGAAGAIVREHPRLTVWVSEVGAPHLVDPAKLESSARRLYGESFDTLWGELTPVPEQNIRLAGGEVLGWEAFPSPGHASHHVCYVRNGTVLAGDAAGVRPQPADYVLPVSPPPEVDVEAWHETIARIESHRPERLALVHFGIATDAADHLARLRAELDRWAAFVRDATSEDEFVAFVRSRVGDDAELYDEVAPFVQSWQGLRRYWDKRAERESESSSIS